MIDMLLTKIKQYCQRPLKFPQTIPTIWVILWLSAISIAIIYVMKEVPLYYSDTRNYWDKFNYNGSLLMEDFVAWLKYIIKNIYHEDYNDTSVLPLLPFYYLFGGNRISYITAMVTMYLMPVAVLITWFSKKLLQAYTQIKDTILLENFVRLTVVSYLSFWMVILRGYSDLVGLLPLLGLYYFYFSHDFTVQLSWCQCLKGSLLVWLPFLLRRWYAYTLVSFFVTVGLMEMGRILLYYRQSYREKLWALAYNLLRLGLLALLYAVLVQGGLVLTILHNNYSELYVAYLVSRPFEIGYLVTRYGLLQALMAFYGIYYASVINHKALPFMLFCLLNLIIYLNCFLMTQNTWIHHNLPIALWMFGLSLLGFYWLSSLMKRYISQFIFLTCMALLWLIGTIYTMFFWFSAGSALLRPLFLFSSFTPASYGIAVTFEQLTHDLIQLLQQDPNATFTFFGHDGLFSTSGIAAAENDLLNQRVIQSPFLDLQIRYRGKYLVSLAEAFKADYAIVSQQATFGLHPQHQQVLRLLTEFMMSGTGPGKAYIKMPQYVYTEPSYVLGSEFKVFSQNCYYILKRVRKVSQEELQELYDALSKFYPDLPPFDYSVIEQSDH